MWWQAIRRPVVAGAAYAVGALRDLYPDEPRFKIGLSVAVGLAVLRAVFWVEYRQTVRPALHVARARGAIMRQLSAPLLKDLRAKGLTVRMNLMVPFRPWWWLWTRRFFRIVWSEGMENQPDADITFPVSQEVHGGEGQGQGLRAPGEDAPWLLHPRNGAQGADRARPRQDRGGPSQGRRRPPVKARGLTPLPQ